MPGLDFTDKPSDPFFFRPLLPLLFALMGGIASGHCFPGYFKTALAGCLPAAAITGIRLSLKKPARLAPFLLYFAMGYLCLSPWQIIPHTSEHLCQLINKDKKSWQITGRVATEPAREGYRVKSILSDIRLADPATSATPLPVRGKLRLTLDGTGPSIHLGDRITFSGRIKPFHNFNNPGGFDYKSFMSYKDIWASTSANGSQIRVKKGRAPGLSANIRNKMRRSVEALITNATKGDSRAILSALVLGKRELLSAPLKQAFNRAGASHVLAISGLHIGIVATFAFFFFKQILGFCKPLLHRGGSGKWAAIMALVPVWGYALLTGMSPSTQRAVIMVSVFLASFLFERDQDLINTLAAAALIILIIYPPSLFSVSFQLSFTAVLTIVLGLSTTQWISRLPGPILPYLLSYTAVSFFAIIGTTPLILHYFNQTAFFGLLTNLIVVPLIGFFVVPLSLFSVLVLLPLHPPMAAWGLKTAGAGIQSALAIIYPIGEWPYSAVKTVTPSILEMICAYTLIFGLFYIIRFKKRLQLNPGCFKRPVVILMTTALLVFLMDIGYWCHARFWRDQFSATIIDVGQGSANLLELPDGYCMLVDGGGFMNNSAFDVGKYLVAPFLWGQKIGTIDTVVLSHPDADHLNGLIYILKHFNVKRVISTHQPSDTSEYSAFIQTIDDRNIHHPPFARIPRHFGINGVKFDLLYPPTDFMDDGQAADTNNCSIVLKATYRGQSIIFPGDIMESAEKELAATGTRLLHTTVLVSPHHGSKTSSTPEFLDAVCPKAVVISAGPKNRFNLPAAAVIERYQRRGYDILMTPQHGAVEIDVNNRRVRLHPVCGDAIRLPH